MTLHIRHYYHVYADGAWQEPLAEHMEALQSSGLLDEIQHVNVGIVGSPDNRLAVCVALINLGIPFVIVAEADEGWEQVTLNVIYYDSQILSSAYVLYAHTKGAANPEYPIQAPWRRVLTKWNVTHWRDNVAALDSGAGSSGCIWMLPENRAHLNWGFYAGNFWWARSDDLARTSPPVCGTRWDAEVWIGSLNAELGLPVATVWNPAVLTLESMQEELAR